MISNRMMKVIETIPELEKIQEGCVLTIGNFDGVHVGHQEVLTAAKRIATQKKTQFIVMTFEPHPFAILHPEKAPGVLTPLQLKEHLLAKYGADCLIVLKDSSELLELSPTDFVEKFLVKNIRPGIVVEGEDFNFGYGRTGSVYTLHSLGQQRGFDVTIIESKETRLSIGHSVKVSSTIIRNMLEAGKIADAAVALGRPYRLVNKTIPGRGRGKKLGFPTLNLAQPAQIIPAEGVYAGFVQIADDFEQLLAAKEKIPAVYSIGQAKTYGNQQPLLIEAHLFKEKVGELTGKWMAMDFVAHIRDQIKFKTDAELSEQIAKDCQKAEQILQNINICS